VEPEARVTSVMLLSDMFSHASRTRACARLPLLARQRWLQEALCRAPCIRPRRRRQVVRDLQDAGPGSARERFCGSVCLSRSEVVSSARCSGNVAAADEAGAAAFSAAGGAALLVAQSPRLLLTPQRAGRAPRAPPHSRQAAARCCFTPAWLRRACLLTPWVRSRCSGAGAVPGPGTLPPYPCAPVYQDRF